MKTNLKKAVRFEVREKGEQRFIQLFDEQGNELDGKNAYWEGNFDCISNQLTTLVGCPKVVDSWFDCRYNQLTTLKGSPEVINGWFDCSNNQLTTLEGSPEYITDGFSCSHNQLTTLEGSPEVIKGFFNCKYNQLTSLVGSPKIIGGNVIIEGKVYSNIEYEYSNKDGCVEYSNKDGCVEYSNKDGCVHLNKYKNIISNKIKFWYCPDCKKDLGDI